MAYIESHQELATNPKTKRAARMLEIPIPHLIGHLHMLWWWAFDHAFDTGDLARYDAYDIADAAGWEGDPDTFVRVLIECGPRGRSGFIDGDLGDNDTWKLHDWQVYTAAMRDRREASAKANHVKNHENKGRTVDSCPYCPSDRSPTADRPESDRRPDGGDPHSDRGSKSPLPHSTEPDLTEPDLPDLPDQPPARAHDNPATPPVNGKAKPGGEQAHGKQPSDAYGQATIGKLDDRIIRRIHTEPPQAIAKLHAALAEAEAAGVTGRTVRDIWDQPTAIDANGIKSIASTAASRIRKHLAGQVR